MTSNAFPTLFLALILGTSGSAAAGGIVEQAKDFDDHQRFEQALQLLDPLVKSGKADTSAYIERARALSGLNRFDDAFVDLRKAKDLDPDNWRPYFACGVTNRRAGNFEDAVTDLDKAIHLNPKVPESFLQRGYCYMTLARYHNNLDHIANVFDASDRFPTVPMRSLYQKALVDYDRALRMNPTNAIALASQGDCYEKLNKFANALKSFNKAIQIDPKNSGALLGRAIVFYRLNEFQKATDDCTRIIDEVDPSNAAAYRQRSFALHDLGKDDLAQQDFSKFNSLTASQH